MTARLIIVPRWCGRLSNDWYQWVLQAVNQPRPLFGVMSVEEMPDPERPTIEAWGGHVLNLLNSLPTDELRRTILVGHSVGCQAILHALAQLDQSKGKRQVYGLVLVAAWWKLNPEFDSVEVFRPWVQSPPDPHLVIQAVGPGGMRVLLSDNDEYTTDYTGNSTQWQQTYNLANIVIDIVPGVNHFKATREPAVRDVVVAMATSANALDSIESAILSKHTDDAAASASSSCSASASAAASACSGTPLVSPTGHDDARRYPPTSASQMSNDHRVRSGHFLATITDEEE